MRIKWYGRSRNASDILGWMLMTQKKMAPKRRLPLNAYVEMLGRPLAAADHPRHRLGVRTYKCGETRKVSRRGSAIFELPG